ncbi:MAG: bifunctional diaminohydroxyphosphoribosylaminopyrimidine deaminase/5-amino-6-(5-phosphoribosylamino)uracil reductase RibD [Actinomycetota bacterium]|nr:bifunctional diaminohydroxyphosphoribosylaminopyrimidine deaminase/5-amino-6-(5-phosphoribosylamino)uracil reductase RibD [Actinomycetota bacterium]
MGEEASSARRARASLPLADVPKRTGAGGRVSDEVFMSRALELARSVPFASPNPRVGAVLVRDEEIVGEGRHLGAGHPHAETEALAGADARGATLYVTLEPCAHHGRTPPCASALVEAGVGRAVAAMTDPDDRVAGKGFEILRSSGIEVEVGLLEEAARRLNAGFIHHRTTGRPLVSLKLALTLDGRLAAPDRSSQWITGPEARALVHRRRAQVDAILVGAGTVTADDPELTARDVGAKRQPVRVIADARGAVSPDARALSRPGERIVATTDRCPHEIQTAYKEAGAEVLILERADRGVALEPLMDQLGARGFLEVLCEGGGILASSLLKAGLVDRLELFYGPLVVGRGGPDLDDIGVTTLSEARRWSCSPPEVVGDGFRVILESPALTSLLAPVERQS